MTARVRRDLGACVAVLLAVFLLEWRFGFLDRSVDINGYLGPVDEVMLALAATTIVALVFALRRVADLRHQIARQAIFDEALIQSEARARLLFDKAPQPMMVFDEDTGRFLAANDAAMPALRVFARGVSAAHGLRHQAARGPGPHRARAGRGAGNAGSAAAHLPAPDARGRAPRRRHHVPRHHL